MSHLKASPPPTLLLREGDAGVKRVSLETALAAPTTRQEDFVQPYVDDLRNVVDMEAVGAAGLKLAVDPLGGAAVRYWEPINATYGLAIAIVNPALDPRFSFMTVDHDGRIRMDCSSPHAMARLVGLKDRYRGPGVPADCVATTIAFRYNAEERSLTQEEVSADSRRRLRLKEQINRLKGDLDWIVMKCLEKDRARRYDTANGLAADLKRHLSNEPIVARPPSVG